MEDSIKQQKSVLRKDIIKRRDALSVSDRKKAAEQMTKALLQHELFPYSENILCFASYGTEIDTYSFMSEVIQRGKKLYVPKIVDNKMIFLRIDSFDNLEPGYKGIPEPKDDLKFETFECMSEIQQCSLIIVPGIAFDKDGNRMGYGKGFYDRFFEEKIILLNRSVAVGFHCQRVEKVPVDEYDKKPAEVLLF